MSEWKSESASSLSEIGSAISLVKETQQEQAEAIKGDLESVSQKCVSDIKEAGMATTSAIAEANNETLNQVQQTKKQAEKLFEEVMALRSSIEAERQTNMTGSKAFLERVAQTTSGLDKANHEINNSISAIKRLQQNTVWLKLADWFSPLLALTLTGGVCFLAGGWLMFYRYNSSLDVFGRNLMKWNNQRIIKCMDDKNPKCTIWIVPPERREQVQ